MAKPPRYSQSAVNRPPADRRSNRPTNPKDFEIVSGSWLVKALLLTLVAAAIALYGTVCLLFYQGQWQFVFFPPKAISLQSKPAMAASNGLPITDVHFDTTEEGVEQLNGWWIPASFDSTAQSAASSQKVVLFCHDGKTALPENLDTLRAFHALGISVFAFDYRGFGLSQPGHPSQQKAYTDGVAALHYLTDERRIDPKRIVIYGADLGAAVAVRVAQQSSQIAGVILENPQSSFAKEVKREQHIHVLPLWLIFPDRFDISKVVPTLRMPKLFLFTKIDPDAAVLYASATAPKQMLEAAANRSASLYTQAAWRQAVQSFLASLTPQSH